MEVAIEQAAREWGMIFSPAGFLGNDLWLSFHSPSSSPCLLSFKPVTDCSYLNVKTAVALSSPGHLSLFAQVLVTHGDEGEDRYWSWFTITMWPSVKTLQKVLYLYLCVQHVCLKQLMLFNMKGQSGDLCQRYAQWAWGCQCLIIKMLINF